MVSVICHFYKKVVLRVSEHGDVIETQPRVLNWYDMHTHMLTTQRLFPLKFLAKSALAVVERLSSLHPQFYQAVKSNKSIATAHAQNEQRTHCDVNTDKSHTSKFIYMKVMS